VCEKLICRKRIPKAMATDQNKGNYILDSLESGCQSSDMAEWSQCIYPRTEVDKAGSSLVPWWSGEAGQPENFGHLAVVVQLWRTAHAFPLNTFQVVLRGRAKK
jgi:hypothetical protein